MKRMHIIALGLLLGVAGAAAGQTSDRATKGIPAPTGMEQRDNDTTSLFRLLGKNAQWQHVASISMDWQTYHTQGLVKIGDVFYVSAVEVLEPTTRNGTTTDALYDFSIDRSPGAGRGWLFKFNAAGHLLGKVELTDGSRYHPGGIDYDGTSIWVAVAEYRPNSKSNIFRVDPDTLALELVFSVDDHIGGIVHNTRRDTLHGVSWGSRRLYTWQIPGRSGAVRSAWTPNPQSYIDYQDCHYAGVEYMLCGGVSGYASPLGDIAFGGLDLVDLRRNRAEHQVPVNQFIAEDAEPNPRLSLAHNAFWLEPQDSTTLRGYFMTESNNQANLIVYEITPWILANQGQ